MKSPTKLHINIIISYVISFPRVCTINVGTGLILIDDKFANKVSMISKIGPHEWELAFSLSFSLSLFV